MPIEPDRQPARFYVYGKTGRHSPSGAEILRIWNPKAKEWQNQPSADCQSASAQGAYEEMRSHGFRDTFVGNQWRQSVDKNGAVVEARQVATCQQHKL